MLRRTLLAAAPLLLLPRTTPARTPLARSHLSGGSSSFLPASYAFSNPFRYNSGYPTKTNTGDGYAPTWADDGNLYIQSNDTFNGFQNDASGANASLAVLDGYTSSVTGHTVNNNLIFGGVSATGPNGWNWKCGGVLSVGSNLFAAMTGSDTIGNFQTQLMKSTDHFATVAPTPPPGVVPYTSPMLPNVYARGFVQYGQAYTGNGPDNSGTYVYMINEAGGLTASLSRVTIANLPNLNGADWTFYTGGDGMNSANWSSSASAAVVMFTMTPSMSPGSSPFLWANPQHLPYFGCYVMVPTYWPGGGSSSSRAQVHVALQPWGPWTQIGAEFDMTPYGALYGLTVAPSSVAVDGGRTTVLVSSGDFSQTDPSTGQYCVHLLTMILT